MASFAMKSGLVWPPCDSAALAPIDVPLSNNWSAISREVQSLARRRSQSLTVRTAKWKARSAMIRDSMFVGHSRSEPSEMWPHMLEAAAKDGRIRRRLTMSRSEISRSHRPSPIAHRPSHIAHHPVPLSHQPSAISHDKDHPLRASVLRRGHRADRRSDVVENQNRGAGTLAGGGGVQSADD